MIWVLTILLGVIVVLLLVILFAPVTFVIDTYQHEYSVKVFGLVKLQPLWNEQGFRILFEIPFYKYEIKTSKKEKQKKSIKTKKEKQSSTKSRFHPKRIAALLETFEVRKFNLTIDTDNYVLNALLYPAFVFLNYHGLAASINFNGETQCQLIVRNNLWRVIWAYIFSSSKTYKQINYGNAL